MNTCIKPMKAWLNKHPKTKQWAWFVILWVGGVMSAMTIAYPIKLLMKAI